MTHGGKAVTRTITRLRGQQGVVLIASYLAVTLFLIYQTAYMDRVVTDHKLAIRDVYRLSALHMGEAGIDTSIEGLRNFSEYPGTGGPAPLGVGTYDATVEATGNTFADEPMTQVEKRITSLGIYPAGYLPEESRTVTHLVTQQLRPFTYGLFSGDKMTVDGDLTVTCFDSPDSTLPPRVCGRVGTNATGPNSIRVTGFTDTDGADLTCGPGCNPPQDIRLQGDGNVVGRLLALPEFKPLPPPNIPPGLATSGDLVVDVGVRYTLPPGQYLFDSIEIMPGGSLIASGPVTVFVTGRVNIQQGGQILGVDGDPTTFILYVILPPSIPKLIFMNPEIKAAVYIYRRQGGSTLEWTGGALAGSLVTTGKLNFSSSIEIMYDVALSDMPAGSTQLPKEFGVDSRAWINTVPADAL